MPIIKIAWERKLVFLESYSIIYIYIYITHQKRSDSNEIYSITESNSNPRETRIRIKSNQLKSNSFGI